MERLSYNAFDIVNELHTERLDYNSEYLPLIDALHSLKAYEDAEEQGLLLRSPCKVVDTVYAITSLFDLGIDIEDELGVFECVVESITFYRSGMHQIRLYHKGEFVGLLVRFTDFGDTVFLTKEEAEQKLAEMKG